MAEVITKFKLETTQYDSKLRDASKSLSEYAKVSSFAGKEFDKFTKDNVEAARALGSIQTSANNAKDKLKELVTAFNTAAKAYNLLTKEQQQSDWGKALAESVQKLQARVTEAKRELYDLSASAKDSGGFIGQLRDKLTVNIDAMKLFGMAVQGTKAALEVIKDAFFASESNIDEWGRTLEGAKGAYNVFLETINGGDWSNFFSNIETAVQGGRDLYDALDRLGSVKTNNALAIATVRSQVQELRLMKQMGESVDEELAAAEKRLMFLERQEVTAGNNAGRQGLFTTLRNNINGKGGRNVVTDQDINNFIDQIIGNGQGQANVDAASYVANQLYQKGLVYRSKANFAGEVNQIQEFDLSKLTRGGQKQYLLNSAFADKETGASEYLQMLAQFKDKESALNSEAFRINRYILRGSSGNSGNTSTQSEVYAEDSIRAQEKLVADLTQKWNTCAAALRDGYKAQLDEAQKTLNEMRNPTEQELFPNLDVTEESMTLGEKFMDGVMAGIAAHNQDVDTQTLTTLIEVAAKNGIDQAVIPTDELMEKIFGDGADIPDKVWQDLEEKINAELAKLNIKPIKLNLETGALTTITETTKEISKGWNTAAKSAKLFGSAMSAIENPSAKVASIIAETVASIAMAYAQTLVKDKTSKSNIFSFIAASTAAMISMTTSIAAVKKATAGSYADGGVIPGNSYSGDNQWAQVNAGEVILTRAQAGSLASQLESSESSSQPHNSYISGEQIVTVVNAYGRRTGRGEILN